MKIYTKQGDKGSTSLFGGQKVSKASARIDAYGTTDELNSLLGVVLSHPISGKGKAWLLDIQNQLFVLGADLATPVSKDTRIERLPMRNVEFLELAIDEMDEQLPPLKSFILPGGTLAAAQLHLARTVCRRAERLVVQCSQSEEISETVIRYLNRLSDFLFVLARFENFKAGTEDTPWIPR
jgi:cob(I)alamin adenosyltransferase